jgi:polyhydroxybutyrate depolymerase
MRKRIVLISLAVIVLLVLVWILVQDKTGTKPLLSSGCGMEPPTVPGETGVHLPADYRKNTATSLVLVFHGYRMSAESMESLTQISLHADEHGYIAVYPQSTSFESTLGATTSWNDLTCNASPGPEGPTCSERFVLPFPPECGEPSDCNFCSCNDDLAFVAQMLDELENTLCIDLDRVYATGVAHGAMFTHRLGCDMADRFAAIAPVAGTLAKGFNCAPDTSTAISLMHSYGSIDLVYPPDGSETTAGYFLVPVNDVIDAWASAESQGCDDSETPYPTSGDGTRQWECVQRANCVTGAEVVSCSWEGDHNSSLNVYAQFVNDVIWEFFSENSKQR